MVEFTEYKLGDICSRLSSGKGINKNDISDKGAYPVYGGNGLRGYTESANFDGECAIIGRQGAFCGNVRYFSGKAYMTEHAVVACANQENNTRYLAYYLSMMNLGRLSGQSAQPGISVKTLSMQPVMMPTLNIQNKVSAILNMLDRKIDLNERINNHLEQLVNALFKAYFTNNLCLYKMTFVPLSDLCVTVTKGTTPTTLGKPYTDTGINFIKAESILNNHIIDKSKFAYIDDETNQLLKRSILRDRDIVFTIAGTLGRFALIDETCLPANTNQAVAIIRVDTTKVMPEYIYASFIGQWHIDYYTKRIQQAVQANLSLTTIKSLPIPLLNESDMRIYMHLITPVIKTIANNNIQNEKLSSVRDALLPELMSGELDVSALDL